MISLMVNTGNVLKFCDFVFCNYQYESMCPAKASNFNVRHFKTFCMLIKECNKINRKEDFQVKSTSVFYIFEKHHICPVADPELFVKRGGGWLEGGQSRFRHPWIRLWCLLTLMICTSSEPFNVKFNRNNEMNFLYIIEKNIFCPFYCGWNLWK